MPTKDLIFRFLGEDVNATQGFANMASSADKHSKAIKDSFGAVPAAVSLTAVAGAAASVKLAADFQEATTQLVTGAGEDEKNLAKVKQGLLDMAPAVGMGPEALAKAMFLVESAGFHGADGLTVMKAAAEAAKIGGADATVVANGLTTAMTDYNLPASKAADVTSKLVATVAAGKSNMQDLSGALSAVLPAASAAHLGLDQVLGSMATMTGEGISAQQASQDLASTIASLSNPSQVQTKAMAQMGLSSLDVARNLGKKGLTGTMDELSQSILTHMGPSGLALQSSFNESKIAAASAQQMLAKLPPSLQNLGKEFLNNQITQKQWTASLKGQDVLTANLGKEFAATAKTANGFSSSLRSGGGDAKTFNAMMADMTGGTTGLNTALALTGTHSATFNSNVKTISSTTAEAGGHVKGWAETQKDFNTQMAEAGAGVEAMGVKVGTGLMPIIQNVVKVGTEWTNGLIANKPALFAVVGVVGTLTGILMGVYVAQKLFAAGAAIMRIAAVASTVAQWALNAAMDANPIGIIVLAIAALVGGLILFFTQTKLGQQIWHNFVTFLGDAWKWLWNSVLKPTFDLIAAVFTWLWNNILKPYIGLIVLEVKVLGAIFSWLWQNVISPVANWIGSAIRVVGQVIGAVFGAIGGTIQHAFSGAVGFVKGAINGIIDVINMAIGGINTLIDGVNSIPGVSLPHLGRLPHMALGGVVTSPTVALIGESGPEAIVPLNGGGNYGTGGGGGLTVQVTVQAGAVGNEQFLARTVTNAIINAIRSGSVNRQELRTALGV